MNNVTPLLSQPVNILLAEEDDFLQQEIVSGLNNQGYHVISANKTAKINQLIQQWLPQVILFRVNAGAKEGWQSLSRLGQRAAVPLIALVSEDALRYVPRWADDFLLLPINSDELQARIQLATARQPAQSDWLTSRNIAVNRATRQVLVGDAREDIAAMLTATELKILSYLLSEPQRIFSRQAIQHACLNDEQVSERTVDSHISKLRKKIAAAGVRFVPQSIRGAGYRLGD